MSQVMSNVRPFGVLESGTVREAVLRTSDGAIEASVIELGAALRDLKVKRQDGGLQRVVLGLTSAEDYRDHSPHMGAIAGRFGNRIAGGKFVLDDASYQLPLNENGRTSLHGGGATGFGKAHWSILHADTASVTLAMHEPTCSNGYPGAMTATCRYRLLPPATLRIELWATTDAATVINLCHHSYFNLDGQSDVLDHELEVRANLYAPVSTDLIPDGTLAAVAGTPLDFRTRRTLRGTARGTRRGIDNTFLLRRERNEPGGDPGLPLAHAATLSSARSGVRMECWTTEPALQVYDGFKLNVPVAGLDGARYGACAGIALEPQHVPDSPNLPHFPSTVLRPGEVYRQVTDYRF